MLADGLEVPCQLLMGAHYGGSEDAAAGQVVVGGRKLFVDLLQRPGALLSAEEFESVLASAVSGPRASGSLYGSEPSSGGVGAPTPGAAAVSAPRQDGAAADWAGEGWSVGQVAPPGTAFGTAAAAAAAGLPPPPLGSSPSVVPAPSPSMPPLSGGARGGSDDGGGGDGAVPWQDRGPAAAHLRFVPDLIRLDSDKPESPADRAVSSGSGDGSGSGGT
eukprot:224891-Chlamydomonas_euryale.AAC.1